MSVLVISTVLLWILVLFNLLLSLALIRRQHRQSENLVSNPEKFAGLEIGQKAPDFTAETLDGETVTLADFANQAVAFIFLSPHCQPCREKVPQLELLEPKLQQNGLELVLVSNAGKAETQIFVDELNIRLPILAAPYGINPFVASYRATKTPMYVLVDRTGRISDTNMMGHNFQEALGMWGQKSEIGALGSPSTGSAHVWRRW